MGCFEMIAEKTQVITLACQSCGLPAVATVFISNELTGEAATRYVEEKAIQSLGDCPQCGGKPCVSHDQE